MKLNPFSTLACATALGALLTGCGTAEPDAPADTAQDPQDAFFDALSTHCGKAYSGSLVSQERVDQDMAGAPMVIHFSECSEDRIAIPFQVQTDGMWDRSRTWIITRGEEGMRLTHDHRHVDGEPDAITLYGGVADDTGTARQQNFPVDRDTIAFAEQIGYCATIFNTWTIEVDPAGSDGASFAYQLSRPVQEFAEDDPLNDCPAASGGRNFRVEFDLTEEVDTPLPAWGAGKSE